MLIVVEEKLLVYQSVSPMGAKEMSRITYLLQFEIGFQLKVDWLRMCLLLLSTHSSIQPMSSAARYSPHFAVDAIDQGRRKGKCF